MPTYLDTHEMGNITEEQLKQALNSPKDEFGVTHKDILYNKEENKAFCIIDAPSKMLWKNIIKNLVQNALG